MLLVLASVAALNGARYGVTAVTEIKSPEFLAAYGALLRVKHKGWKPTVPVPEDVRERLYDVSPAFAELKPSLAGEPGKRWSSMFRGIREVCKKDTEIARKIDMYLNRDASGIGNFPAVGWIITTSMLISVICRLIVLSLIHVTSFPAIIPQYLAPAYPLVLIFIAVVLINNLREPQFWRKKRV